MFFCLVPAEAGEVRSAMAGQEEGAYTIDEDLQSRQLAVYGRESMRMLRDAHVLLVGVDGVGAEIAKNVILANVKAVTLCDTAKVELSHLSSHFYLTEKDVGQPLAEACVRRLQELNPSVRVSTLTEVPADVEPYSCVVANGVAFDVASQLNDACRARKPGSSFIRCAAHGLFGEPKRFGQTGAEVNFRESTVTSEYWFHVVLVAPQ